VEIYFLRHGEAVAMDAWAGAEDDRPLAAEGVARMEREAASLSALGIAPDAIITSPLARARQTAEIVARRLRIPDSVTVDKRLAPGFRPDQLVHILKKLLDDTAVILLVGHEPDFGRTIARCIGGGRMKLTTGGLACVNAASRDVFSGTLAWLLPARVLAP
jgi:phosphohistidine phosphatase